MYLPYIRQNEQKPRISFSSEKQASENIFFPFRLQQAIGNLMIIFIEYHVQQVYRKELYILSLESSLLGPG